MVDEAKKRLPPAEAKEYRDEITDKTQYVRLILSYKIYKCDRCGIDEIPIPEWNNNLDDETVEKICPNEGCVDIKRNFVFK